MNNYENNIWTLSVFYIFVEAALKKVPLYSNRENKPLGISQKPHEFDLI